MYEQIARNKRRTWYLMGAFVAIVVLVALALGIAFGGSNTGVIVAIALVIAIALAWASYWKSDSIALAASRAHPADAHEFARLHNLVEGLCLSSGLPKPRLYIVDDPSPNAFATGRNPKHAAVAVTTGLLEKMNRVELEAVLAHELSHVRNYDTLIATVAVTMVGTIALIADLGWRAAFWGSLTGDNDDRDGGGGIAGIIAVILSVVLLVLAPIIGRVMQAAVSRRRELLADAAGVAMTRYPPGLISALEKLKDDNTVVHSASKATAQLWIESPLETDGDDRQSSLNRWFDTHPPLDVRIHALQEM